MRDQPGGLSGHDVIDLAVVPDFVLGALRVEPALRRVSAGGRVESVEPRVMQALVALVEAGGTVVSRDMLVDRCWSGRIVGEDAINRCVAKVRKLADVADPPAFAIETVAKVGYLLRVPDVAVAASAAIDRGVFRPVDVHPEPAQLVRWLARHWRRWPWLAVGATIAAIVSVALTAALWRARPPARWTVQSSRMLLLDGEASPRISPNGNYLAYVVNAQFGRGRIYVRSLAGGTSVAVSAANENADQPAWASDNAQLAYVVTDPAGGPCRIMVTTFPGGAPRVAGRCQSAPETQITWQPGTSHIYYTDSLLPTSAAIFRIDIETGGREQVTAPGPLATESDESPRVSPDGHYLAYIREHGLAGHELRVRTLATGAEQALTSDPDMVAVDWAPDSRTVIASVPGTLGNDIIAYPIDGAPSYRVYASAAGLGGIATGPGGVLAVEAGDLRHDLARATRAPHAAVDVIDPAPGMTEWPAFAPDGTLAFVSGRSGEVALWTRKPGAEPALLVHGGAKLIERPVWSPDGDRIAFVEIWKGDITVRVITAQGEAVVSFSVPSIGWGQPNWTPDGQHLVVFDKTILRPVRVDLRNPAHRDIIADSIMNNITYRGGAIYAAAGIDGGLWQLDQGAKLTLARLVTKDYPTERHARLAFVGDTVLLPGPRDRGTLRILAQPLNGGPSRVAFYAPAAEAETPFVVDPRTGDVVYISEVIVDARIDLLTIVQQ